MESNSTVPNKLHFERSIYEQFMEYTRRFSKNEWGGLLIGTEIEGELYCVAAIIPPQKSKSTVYCEFKKELFTVIFNCFEKIEEEYDHHNFRIITWIHTHPGFGVFLSGTDLETYNYLIKLNPNWSAIVVDPVKRDYLAVNSTPGNLNGFSTLEVDLNYLYDFDYVDQTLFNKLQIIKNTINSGLNRRLLKIEDTEKVEVFIPIPPESLRHSVMQSRLEGLIEQTQSLKASLFQRQPKSSKQSTELPTESAIEGVNPAIQELEQYIKYFQKIESEIEKWNYLSLDRTLFAFDFRQFSDDKKLLILKDLQNYSRLFWATPIIRFKLTDNYLFHVNPRASVLAKWKDIRSIEIDLLDEINNFYLIRYKKGRIFGKKKLLLCFPQQYLKKFKDILEMKAPIFYRRRTETDEGLERYANITRKKRARSEEITMQKEKSSEDSVKKEMAENSSKHINQKK